MNCPNCSEEMTVVDVVARGASRGLLLIDPTTHICSDCGYSEVF